MPVWSFDLAESHWSHLTLVGSSAPRRSTANPARCLAFLAIAIASVSLAAPPEAIAAAEGQATLWVVQPPGVLVAYDPADFSRIGAVRIPAVAVDYPERLAINGRGQLMIELGEGQLWIWDSASSKVLSPAPKAAQSATVSEGTRTIGRQWFLGGDGASLLELETVSGPLSDSGFDSSATRIRGLITDLQERPLAELFGYQYLPCQHSVEPAGAQPCAGPQLWAPGNVVNDFFILTHWERGDDPAWSSEELPEGVCHQTVYQRRGDGWRSFELDDGEAGWLDACEAGTTRVQADGGLGWVEEEGCDVAAFATKDTAFAMSDECSQFRNENYDVGLLVKSARISPSGHRVAVTTGGTAAANADFTVRIDAHPDSLALISLRHSLAEMPVVDAYEMRPGPVLLLRLVHAELVGWVSKSEVLIVEAGRLVAIDVNTKHRRESSIFVRSPQDAFLIRR